MFDAEFEYEAGDPTGYRAGEAKPGGQSLGKAAGGDGLNVRLYELPPGQSLCPYHYEYAEEWLLVLDGAPTLRVPHGEQPLQRGELVCFPPGPDGAHKVTNDTEQTADPFPERRCCSFGLRRGHRKAGAGREGARAYHPAWRIPGSLRPLRPGD